MCESLSRLAALAPTLKEAELRILLHLVAQGSATESTSIAISSRTLSASTKLARPNGQKAVAALVQRGLISTDGGSATRPSIFKLDFLVPEVLLGRGFVTKPPLASEKSHPPSQNGLFGHEGGIVTKPPLASEKSQGGIVTKPPPIEEPATYENRSKEDARVENFSNSNEQVLDRVLKAATKKLDDDDKAWGREWLYGYMRKLGPEREPHPPDTQIIAQFLAIAPRSRLEALLGSMFKARLQAGRSYAWFVSVALDRIHGMKYTALRERRAELELVKKPRPAPAEQQPLDEPSPLLEVEELKQELRSLAAAKGMR